VKNTVVFLMLISILTIWAQASEEYKIFSCQNEKEISIDELAKLCNRFDVIFFGEFHENKILHKLEIELLKAMWKAKPDITVSMEMFERDVQSFLNDYLQGKISEEEFLKSSRPWNNYQTDYKPLIEFAKEHKLHVIAANVPRDYANQINQNGIDAFEKLAEKQLAAKKLIVKEGDYQKKFYQTMQNMSHGSPMMKKSMSEDKLYNLYAAQCLKDDTMAESIFLYIQKNPKDTVIHFNGDFHSNSYLGTVEKLEAMNPELSIGVITPNFAKEIGKFPKQKKDEADFIIQISEK
jgi:uncharacterized iron-regulated protein